MADVSVESRMSHLEGAFEQITRQLTSIEGRFSNIDARFAAVDGRLEALDRKIDQRIDFVLTSIDRRFMWTVGIVVGTWATTMLGILAILVRH